MPEISDSETRVSRVPEYEILLRPSRRHGEWVTCIFRAGGQPGCWPAPTDPAGSADGDGHGSLQDSIQGRFSRREALAARSGQSRPRPPETESQGWAEGGDTIAAGICLTAVMTGSGQPWARTPPWGRIAWACSRPSPTPQRIGTSSPPHRRPLRLLPEM